LRPDCAGSYAAAGRKSEACASLRQDCNDCLTSFTAKLLRLAARCGARGIIASPTRGVSRPPRCVPSPQRGEGQDEGVLTQSTCSGVRTPHPNPLPSGEREFAVPASADFHSKRLRSRDASRRPSFSARDRE
jgi:hypothetical protein